MKIIDKIALVLIIIGAINWGLIGIFNFNLVAAIFGDMTIIARIIYGRDLMNGLVEGLPVGIHMEKLCRFRRLILFHSPIRE